MPPTKKNPPASKGKSKGNGRSGRPVSFKAEFVEQARKLCSLGATDYELADFFKVDTRTIYRWKNTFPDFCQAVVVGKEKADDRVERALYNRAVGYSYESEKLFQAGGEVIRADIIEHVPPDAGAAMNWLKNRRPGEWRDKIDHVHGVTGEVATLLDSLNGKTRGLPNRS